MSQKNRATDKILVTELLVGNRAKTLFSRICAEDGKPLRTVGQLAKKTVEELWKYRSLGRKSLIEIQTALENIGSSLSGTSLVKLREQFPELTISQREAQSLSLQPIKPKQWARLESSLRHEHRKKSIQALRDAKNQPTEMEKCIHSSRGPLGTHCKESFTALNASLRTANSPFRVKQVSPGIVQIWTLAST